MGSGALSPYHILIVALVALLVLGPAELPKMVRTASRLIGQVRTFRKSLEQELRTVLDDEGSTNGGIEGSGEPSANNETPPAVVQADHEDGASGSPKQSLPDDS
jgi:Sec-independent protein translocase protein TatA